MSRMWDIVAVIVGLLGVLFVTNSMIAPLTGTGFALTIMATATIVAIGGLIVYALRSMWN